jgi:hypothetical protein
MNKFAIFLLTLFVLCVLNLDIFAETESYVNLSTGGSTNAFYLDSATDVISTGITAGINYYPNNSQFGYFAELNYLNYFNFTNRNYFNGYLGLMYTKPFDSAMQNVLNISGSFNSRLDASDYDIYDYNQLMLNFTYLHNYTEQNNLEISYNPRLRLYSNYSTISYIDNTLSTEYSHHFATKTGLVITGAILNKNYMSVSQATKQMMFIEPKSKNDFTILKKNQYGKRMLNPSDMKTMPNNMNSLESSSKSISQVTLNLHVSQNLFENTGLAVEFFASRYLNSIKQVNVDGSVSFDGESELFDDPYSFENSSVVFTLTQILPFVIIAKLNSNYADKRYSYFSYSIDSSKIQRKDKFLSSYVSLSRDFPMENFWVKNLNVEILLSYLKNESSVDFFNYNNTELLLTFSFGF